MLRYMNNEPLDEQFWEEHKLEMGLAVGGLFAAAGALALRRLARQEKLLSRGIREDYEDQDLGLDI